MINVDKLKKTIKERGKTQEEVISHLTIDRSTYFRKMNKGGGDLDVKDIQTLKEVIPLTDDEAVEIFLTNLSKM